MPRDRHRGTRRQRLRRRARSRIRRVTDPVWAYWKDLLTRIVAVQTVDRGVALGAQAFTAIVPLLMLFALIAPRKEGRDFAETVISRYELTGDSAAAFRDAFAPAGTVSQSFSIFGTLLAVVAALSFTRTLQRLYENAYALPALGLRGTPWGLLWLAALIVAITVNPVLLSFVDGMVALVVAIALASIVWGFTPYILTARRITKRQALPAAMLAGIAMTILSVGSTIWLPLTVSSSALQFGMIGVAFAFVSWLVVAGLTLAGTAVAGAVLAEHLGLPTPADGSEEPTAAALAGSAGRQAGPDPARTGEPA